MTDANTGGSFNRYNYANNSPYKYVDPDGRDSLVITGGGSLVVGGGIEGSAGVYFTGYPDFDIGVVASGGYGAGFNVGLGAAVALIPGPTANIAGVTSNTNVSTAVASGTVMRDPVTGKVLGRAIGPAAKLGASQTTSKTGTFGVRDLVYIIAEKLSPKPKKQDPPKPEPKPVPKKDPPPEKPFQF